MRLADQLRFNWQVFSGHPLRTALLLLAVAIGVAAVIMLTSLGEGARRYIDAEFSSLGNRLIVVFPGRNETTGGAPPVYGNTARDLTLEDARALGRIPSIRGYAPIIAGTTPVSRGSRSREVITLGTNAGFFDVRQVTASQGRVFPARAETDALAICVLGDKLKQELFGNDWAVGEWVRIGDRRMRVIGVLEDKGESFGMDMSDIVLIPVKTAEQIFNTPGLFRVILELGEGADQDLAIERIYQVIRDRHEGEDDVTVVTQDSILAAFNNILTVLTLAIAAIGAISLVVAGILVMNISLISVSQRRGEIGLLKAIGASRRQVRELFLGESMLLMVLGIVLGAVFAYGVVYVVRGLYPAFPLMPPWWAVPSAALTALSAGLLFSWLPARRASNLDPVLAMRGIAE
ncbi:MAG: peptide ABC transporter permease [Porticoccaceae bacterium]|nr:peptide ABC transporter permease [Porticoccaceae bacterium]